MAGAIGLLLLLAACDTIANMEGHPVSDPAEQPAGATGPQSPSAIPSRAVAVMASRSPQSAGPAIVVRGRDPALGRPNAPDFTPHDTGPGDVTLNFAGADVRDVVAEVLGHALKMNYVIDPDVTGPINFNVSRPLRRDELLPLLETVLNSRGATMVQNDGTVRVMMMRKDGKPAVAAPIVQGFGRPVGDHTEAFPLRFVGASDMQHVLEKIMPAGAVVSPDDKQHMLLVQGSPADLQLAQDTIRVFDVDQMSGMSMALVPLRNADPSAVADEVRNIFQATRKETDSDSIRLVPVKRLNAVMVISRSPRYMDEARAWLSRLDRSRNPNEQRVYVYNLQYSKAVQVGQKLQGLLGALDIQFHTPTQGAAGEGLGAAGAPALAATTPGDALTGKPLDAKPGAPAGGPIAPIEPVPPSPLAAGAVPDPTDHPGVRIEADEAHNALLISASARDYELIRQVLQGIDVPPLQVLIEVTVAEVTLNDTLNYGVEYWINSGKVNSLLTTAASAMIAPATPGFALSWVTGNFQPRAILDALSDVTETKVISTPRLLVLSNQTARLQVGDVVPIITQSATSTVTSNPLVLNNVTYKETGVVLEVTPRVNSGGFVTMDVNQAVSDVVNTTTSTIDSPTIRQRQLNSTISVKSGQTILLGGLIQQNSSRETSGIPVLDEIPGLGTLFGNRNNSAGRTELIMLMTPHVIANEDQARDVTARVEQQFQDVLNAEGVPRPRRPH
ncbi:MAG TPA: type II secretion system secretin GspD [Stellaceae bacterium]|jgi:general secretion pathway protein D|nr:type II secretion system secretin GspD [Stellaceae bacterium]